MATTRVYILAKELGVKSTAIVKKCQDEGLDVKNHMSTISAGLAATIREWFSEGDNVTTIETSKKVDLKKVRVKKKPKKSKKIETIEESDDKHVAEQSETKELIAEEANQENSVSTTAVEETTEEAEAKEQETTVEENQQAKEETKPDFSHIIPEPKPEKIVPAGPKLEKPAPAKLSGPKVIRVEKPEPEIEKRRPRPRKKSRHEDFATEPLLMKGDLDKIDMGETDKKDAVKKGKDRTHGRKRQDIGAEPEKHSKFQNLRRLKDIEERRARLNAAGGEGLRLRPRRKIYSKTQQQTSPAAPIERPTQATIASPVTVKSLSTAIGVKIGEIISKLMQQGTIATANQALSNDVAELISLEFGTELTIERKSTCEEDIQKEFDELDRKNAKRRPVIATMLGHVDHGKTSLLDKIRTTHVADGEAGGITQHIAAYQVTTGENIVTFLDTPGHAAFTALRARGANMTDVVVLVVAADDGVMPQTVEVINHAKAAAVPVLVALNKIDLPGVDINRIYSQLSEHELTPVEWGGNTEIVKTSATTGEGIDELLEHLDYIAELQNLQADDTIPATGWIVEAKMTIQEGPVATMLVKEGQFKKGDIILSGVTYGRVKSLKNSFGKTIKKAISSMPVEITGLNDVPQAGDKFYCLKDINKAKTAANENYHLLREKKLAQRTQVTMDNLFAEIEAGNVKDLNIIIRADVQGSIDVLTKYLTEISTAEIKIKVLHAAPGGITEGDVVLAEASNAIIIGFNVVAEDHVAKIAEEKGIDIRLYSIIYRITEDLKKSMVGMLEPEEQERHVGRAVIRNTFKVSRYGTIAGCYVVDGVVTKSSKARLIRDNIVLRDNLTIDSLKHFKDDAREVKTGLECGIKLANFDDVKIDDFLDFYEIVKIARTL